MTLPLGIGKFIIVSRFSRSNCEIDDDVMIEKIDTQHLRINPSLDDEQNDDSTHHRSTG
jgi:hypothetical protein